MNEEDVRPNLTLHVFGSGGCGKKSLKRQWFDGSHSPVLSEIADIHIRIQKECSLEDCGFVLNSRYLDLTTHAFLVMYRPDSQGSITFAYQCVEKLYAMFEGMHLKLAVLENHFEPTFRPHIEAPVELPLSKELSASLLGHASPLLWRACVLDSVQLHSLFDHVIVAPLLALLDEDEKAKVVEAACREGKVQVVKLLLGTMEDSNPVTWLAHTMASLESADTTKTAALMTITRYAYNLDHTLTLSTIVRLAQRYPKASLHLLDTFCKQGSNTEHFIKSGVALVSLPPSWVTSGCFTHINLSNNLLTCLPEGLFQVATLRLLNVSHNCIESIPSILKWNCPYLRDLNLSHNRLLSVPYCILEGRNRTADTYREREMNKLFSDREDQQKHITAVQRVMRLTGYNLYPCIRSVSRVNISHNPSLAQIPEWVCLLPSLTLLEAVGLPKLTTLTPYLAHCRFLCVLRVDTSILVSPPPEEANRGTRVIMAYLRCKLRGSTPYRRVRLVLMGETGSGKSTLFKQLIGSKASNGTPLPHMEIATFEFPSRLRVRRDKPRVTFHMIDFAGSEIYRCTHQCFLTYRSIYLCLWDITEGKEALRKLCPWLRSIQACVPGSPVVLVATHADRRPGVSGTTVAQWQEEVLGDVHKLKKRPYTAKLGLPPIHTSVIMDCLSKDDIDLLMSDVYDIALQLRHPRTQVPFLEDMVPHSYQELQSLVEVKVRSLSREWQNAPILRHEEFVDYVRSLTLHNPDDLEQDEEEFTLACNFLHEAGTIVHFKSHLVGVSDLYFLDPQWLFNILASVINSRVQSSNCSPVIECSQLPQILQSANIPPKFYGSFLSMMESFDILVSLDMEKNSFLMPSLLSTSPPPHYPSYDLSTDTTTITQYVQFSYLPTGFFPRLLARVLTYIRQLSGQLLMADSTPLTTGEDEPDWSISGLVNAVTSSIRSAFSHHFNSTLRLDRHGYMYQDDSKTPQDEGTLRNKIWALSATNTMVLPVMRRKALTEKLVTISKPILKQRSPTNTSSKISDQDPHHSFSHADHFASYVFWKDGLFVEFPCGTRFWMEACSSAVVLVISGRVVPRVKVLSFITSCIDVLTEECYSGLDVVYYSPCPSCMRRFWQENQTPSFASSSLEVSQMIKLDEFNEIACYSPQTDTVSRLYSFSGSSLKVNQSITHPLSTSPPLTTSDSTLDIAILENNLTLFPLATTILQSVSKSTLTCPKCEVDVSLNSISPHVLLVDFADKLLLKPALLQFQQDEDSLLGRGGFGKVYLGTYDGNSVAVKVFQRPYKHDVLLQQYKNLREELTIMSYLDHPRVVSLVGVALRPLCMVMQLAPQCSLTDHLDLCPHGLQHKVAHSLLFQIADGIRYLHSLFIIHRDIKPGNVLVWSLHPDQGVDVRLADYGVSQFSTPSGLWRHKGTEEYMAPELFKSHRNQAYDEKVDIFSFALVLHLVVTGRKLFASIVNKREQLRMIYNTDFPKLSVGLAEALKENKMPSPIPSHSQRFLEGGKHPAARSDVISSCHSVCMQQLMEDCLMLNPADRPSAQGVCSRLLVCPGGLPQANFFITTQVTQAMYSESADVVLAVRETSDCVLLLTPGSWQMQLVAIPYRGEKICCMTIAGSEVFFASEDTNLVFSFCLPSLTSGHISPFPLPSKPLCIFPQPATGSSGTRIIVGMSSGRIAVFVPPNDGRTHLLETNPIITQVVNHPNADKTAIMCGVYHENTIWCGCGRYIIGLDSKEYLLKHYKPVLKELTSVARVEGSYHHLWISFQERSEIVLCDCFTAHCMDTINCHTILSVSGVSSHQAVVTDIVSSPDAVWVGTQGGHLIAFNPISTDVVLVHQRHSSLSCIVSLATQQEVVTFGLAEVEGEEDGDTLGTFTVWTSFVHVDS